MLVNELALYPVRLRPGLHLGICLGSRLGEGRGPPQAGKLWLPHLARI
jgi:hypothetical protein